MKPIVELVRAGQLRPHQRTAARGAPVCAVVFDRLGPNVWHRSPAQAQFDTPCRLLGATW